MHDHVAPASDIVQLGNRIDNLQLNRRHYLVFALCAIAFAFDAFDFQMLSLIGPTLSKEWNLTSSITGFLFSSAIFGMLAGTLVFGTVSDRIGRRNAFQLTVAIFAVFSGLCAFADNVWQLIALRFLTGVGIGGFIPVDTAVMAEFMPARYRGRMLGLWAIFLPIGGSAAAWVGSYVIPTFGWRAFFLVSFTPAIFVLAARFLIPETPRWLMSKGRYKEAEHSINWIARGQAAPETAAATGGPAAGPKRVEQPRVRIRDLFSRKFRRQTALAWTVWFASSFVYFGMYLWVPSLLAKAKGLALPDVYHFMIGFSAAGIAGRLVVAAIVDRVGRKPIIVASAGLAGIFAVVFGWQSAFWDLVIWGYLVAFFLEAVSGCKAPWTPELYPTYARATGVGWATGAGRLASSIAPIVIGFLVPISVNLVFVCFAVFMVITAVVAWTLGIETAAKPLVETTD